MKIRVISFGFTMPSEANEANRLALLSEMVQYNCTVPLRDEANDVCRRGVFDDKYDEVKVMLSDQRQSFTEDKWHEGGSFLDQMEALTKKSNKKAEFLPFLLADAMGELDPGVSYQRALQTYQNNYDGEHADGQVDPSKLLVLYAQMQYIANHCPRDAKIEFEFYDKDEALIQQLRDYFNEHNLLIPSNVVLYLLVATKNKSTYRDSFTGKEVTTRNTYAEHINGHISGTGPVDENYYQSLQSMALILENAKIEAGENAEAIRAIDVINYDNLSILSEQFQQYNHYQNTITVTWKSGDNEFDITKLARKDAVRREDLLNPDLDFVVTGDETGRVPVRLKAGKLFMSYCPGGKDSYILQLFTYDQQGNLKQLMNSSQNRYGWTKFEELVPVSLDAFYPSRTFTGFRYPKEDSPAYDAFVKTKALTKQIRPMLHQLMLGNDVDNVKLSQLIVEYANVDAYMQELKSESNESEVDGISLTFFSNNKQNAKKPLQAIVIPEEDFRDIQFFGAHLEAAPVNLSEVAVKIATVFHLNLGITNEEVAQIFQEYCDHNQTQLTEYDIRVIRMIPIDQKRYCLKSILGENQDEAALEGFPQGYNYHGAPQDALDQGFDLFQTQVNMAPRQ